jgi:hypothetical protein
MLENSSAEIPMPLITLRIINFRAPNVPDLVANRQIGQVSDLIHVGS